MISRDFLCSFNRLSPSLFPGKIHLVSLVLVCLSYVSIFAVAQIADPVAPHYDHSTTAQFFTFPYPTPDNASISELSKRMTIGFGEFSCLNHATMTQHAHNQMFFYGKYEELPHHWDNKTASYFEGTTYWFNEDLHVGHVHYDITLVQVLQSTKVDRVIMQRSVCRANVCNGIGAIESFYKGYFAALFDAFDLNNKRPIPVYLRYHGDIHVKPIYFSIHHPNLIDPSPLESEKYKEIELKPLMCFEKVIRRGKPHTYGGLPTVSPSAVQAFKRSAYKLTTPPLNTYFVENEPYTILFSYRGTTATRHISNIEIFFDALRKHFASPKYKLRLLNSSNPDLDYKTQLKAVAESHVVIANHGAFEGNMIYMKNSSLLLEIFGQYGNNEIHTFHRLAIKWGLFYARVHPTALTDHLMESYAISDAEIANIVYIIKDYFEKKPFRFNMKKAGEE